METENLNCNEAPTWFIDAVSEQENDAAEVSDQLEVRQKASTQSLGFV